LSLKLLFGESTARRNLTVVDEGSGESSEPNWNESSLSLAKEESAGNQQQRKRVALAYK